MFCGATVASAMSLPLLLLGVVFSVFACCIFDVAALPCEDAASVVLCIVVVMLLCCDGVLSGVWGLLALGGGGVCCSVLFSCRQ